MTHRRLWMILLTMAVLVGCARASAIAPTSTPVTVATETDVAIRSHSGGGTVVASGEIAPAREAQLGFTVSGRVETVAVAEGDDVQTGETLVTLETILLEADVAQAEAALAAAQAQLALLEAGPRPGQVAAAEAQ
ncbi:MAG: biotin/lipoyl-binding protein, partial [Chloroflexota bacterium]|nr:biotin/lipoyl-binding protein [Chloroflexota bacterium]